MVAACVARIVIREITRTTSDSRVLDTIAIVPNMSPIVTDEEAAEIVARAHNSITRLLHHSVKERDKHGYLGIHLTLSTRAEIRNREVDDSFFMKTYRIPAEGQVDFLGETGMFNKEVILYRDVFRKFRDYYHGREWCPQYYFSKNRVLVLEDLSLQGFQIKPEAFTLDEEHVKLVLKVVSALHASSIAFEKSSATSLDSQYPACFKEILYDEENTKAPSFMWKRRQTRDLVSTVQFLEKYTREEKQLIKRYLPVAIDRIYQLSKKSNRWVNVLVHGDMWSNNIMFRYEEGHPVDCRLVDFQFSRYAPPMHDVMHLLHLTTDKAFRDKMEDSLLKAYHESLGEMLAVNDLDITEILPWETFLESRNSYKLLAIIQSLLSMHYLLGGRRVQDESEYGKWSKSEVDDYLIKVPPDNVKGLLADVTYTARVVTILYELIDDYILDEQRSSVDIS